MCARQGANLRASRRDWISQPKIARGNPEGIESLSPGLRVARYPGWAMVWGVNLESGCIRLTPSRRSIPLPIQVLANASEIVVQFLP